MDGVAVAKPASRGAMVGRGPRASDHYTTVHNLIFRGFGIHTRYVGVFGYIIGQSDGWMLTEQQIAEDLGVGVDFIRSALKSFEAAGCLIRDRLREPDGRLGGAVWFITDLPAQLTQLGIGPEEISERVRAAYEEWLAAPAPASSRRSGPIGENPAQASTRGFADANEASEEDRPTGPRPAGMSEWGRSAPISDFPGQAEPGQVNPGRKKKEIEEEDPDRQAAAGDAPAPPAACRPAAEKPRTAKTATNQPSGPGADLLRALRLAEPVSEQVVRQCHEHVTELLETWTAPDLMAYVTRQVSGGNVRNLMGLVTRTVRDMRPKPAAPGPARPDAPAWCGACGSHYPDDRAAKNPRFRLVLDPERDVETPCGACHPSRVSIPVPS
jgi:hypothetical protein